MSLTIPITKEIRDLPYFSSFTEPYVEVPNKPFLHELLYERRSPETFTIKELCSCIETSIYFGLETDKFTMEFLWKIGANIGEFKQWFVEDEKQTGIWSPKDGLPILLEKELISTLGETIDRNRLIRLGVRCMKPSPLEMVNEGNLRLLEWEYFLYGDRPFKDVQLSNAAARRGHLDCLKYLWEHECPFETHIIEHAAQGGHLDCMEYLHGQGFPVLITSGAIEKGDLDCLKYLHKHGCGMSSEISSSAACFGKLEYLKYLGENGCPWRDSCIANAAGNGYLECVKYLCEQGAPRNEMAVQCAAEQGQLECLRYLVEQGFPWDRETMIRRARGHPDCLSYLLDYQRP